MAVLTLSQPWPKNRSPLSRIFIGVSGGLDSIVLAHLIAHTHPDCVLVHVHHHLQVIADSWPQFVADFSKKYKLKYRVHHVDVKPNPGDSIEDFARRERYAFFASLLTEPSDILCLAHHQDDQIETFFLNLARGSGLNGLTAMSHSRPLGQGLLWRPLLGYSRGDLEGYAKQHHLKWIEDPSNQDQRFDRNFLRQQVMPILKQRWPHFQNQVESSISHLQESRQILDAHLEQMLHELIDVAGQMKLEKIRALNDAYQKLLLQLWFKNTANLRLSTVHLERIIQDFLHAPNDAQPLFEFHGWRLTRDRVYLFLQK